MAPISVLSAIVLCSASLQAAEVPLRRAPELAFRIPGAGEQLLSSYRGKVVSLEFIYTTCLHCQQASQLQKRLQQTYARQGFQAIDVAINPNADLLAENFTRDFQLNFPVGWTTPEQALTFLGFQLSKLYVVPQIVIVDQQGYIRAQTTPKGEDAALDAIRSENSLTNMIRELLSGNNRTDRARR